MDDQHSYQPPYTLTPEILNLVAQISEVVGRLSVLTNDAKGVRLRRINRIRTIQGSLAIEGNTLSAEQIIAILDGKRVVAPPREVQEVRNAIIAYDRFEQLRPDVEADLLGAHRDLMTGLIDEVGVYRRGGVGVREGEQIIHMAPPAEQVPLLMSNLFHWMTISDIHPLILSSIFHYEFEFIHPFVDGNGRVGRLWQSVILRHWSELFANIPVESLIYEHQSDYYQALQKSTEQTDSAPFIEFMLKMILAAVISSPQVSCLLNIVNGEISREALQNALDLQDRKSFRQRYIKPALIEGLIEMTLPDKPNSRLQKYRLTGRGQQWLEGL